MPARRALLTTSALALVALGLLTAAPAQAAAYRYWTYWQGGSGSWTFATAGPGASVPSDGSVEGWRFAVTTQSGSAKDAPRVTPDFAAICGATAAQDGRKRVALVLDPGPAEAAPDGQQPPDLRTTCVVADPSATGYQVLRSVTTVRTDTGLICGIGGYPTGECAPVVDDPTAEPTGETTAEPTAAPAPSARPSASIATSGMDAAAQESASGSPVATIVVAVLLLGAAAFWIAVRRRGSGSSHG